jgi:hypothetical protein
MAKTDTMTVSVRMPADMYRHALWLAEQGERSLNRQLVYLIRKGLTGEHQPPAPGDR